MLGVVMGLVVLVLAPGPVLGGRRRRLWLVVVLVLVLELGLSVRLRSRAPSVVELEGVLASTSPRPLRSGFFLLLEPEFGFARGDPGEVFLPCLFGLGVKEKPTLLVTSSMEDQKCLFGGRVPFSSSDPSSSSSSSFSLPPPSSDVLVSPLAVAGPWTSSIVIREEARRDFSLCSCTAAATSTL